MKELSTRLLTCKDTFGVSYIEHLRLVASRESLIYTNLNKLTESGDLLKGYFWCPTTKRKTLKDSLARLREDTANFDGVEVKKVKTTEDRPTYFATNDFTAPFQ